MDIINPLLLEDVRDKLKNIETACHQAFLSANVFHIPHQISRNVEVRSVRNLPQKRGVGSNNGQARLFHDLASIELQAMEMSFRSLVEFPEAPADFRSQLLEIVLDEARHLELCLEQIKELGFSWGDWPVHTGLWDCLSKKDSLLDRLFIVHRYLEGSGLDAGDKILRRLSDVSSTGCLDVVRTISDEELGHVQFGSYWYQRVCKDLQLDPDEDFRKRSADLFHRLPRRLEPICEDLRYRVGFTREEVASLKQLQGLQLSKCQ